MKKTVFPHKMSRASSRPHLAVFNVPLSPIDLFVPGPHASGTHTLTNNIKHDSFPANHDSSVVFLSTVSQTHPTLDSVNLDFSTLSNVESSNPVPFLSPSKSNTHSPIHNISSNDPSSPFGNILPTGFVHSDTPFSFTNQSMDVSFAPVEGGISRFDLDNDLDSIGNISTIDLNTSRNQLNGENVTKIFETSLNPMGSLSGNKTRPAFEKRETKNEVSFSNYFVGFYFCHCFVRFRIINHNNPELHDEVCALILDLIQELNRNQMIPVYKRLRINPNDVSEYTLMLLFNKEDYVAVKWVEVCQSVMQTNSNIQIDKLDFMDFLP